MYRSRKDDSDHSDDEDDKNPMRDNHDDDYEPKQKRATVWTDVAVERQLNFRGSNINLNKDECQKKFQRVSRGAETYEVPIEETVPKPNVNIPVVTVTPVTDDPFGEHVDLSTVEEFGVGPSVKRGRGRGGFRGRGRGRGAHYNSQDTLMDVSSGETGASEKEGEQKQRSQGWMRGRGRGQYWQGRAGHRGRGVHSGQKRNFNGGPAQLVTEDYSLEALMNTEFQQGISLQQLGQDIAQALGEKEPGTVLKIVEAIGEQKALNLFDETREIEAKGGMKTQDNSRRRTPGGVFISLFKADVDVTPEVKDKIFEESKAEQRRLFKQAKRRNFQDKMKEVAELIKKDKEKDSDLKPLEEVTDVVVPELNNSAKNVDNMES